MTDDLVAVVGGVCFAVDRDCARDKSSFMIRRASASGAAAAVSMALLNPNSPGPRRDTIAHKRATTRKRSTSLGQRSRPATVASQRLSHSRFWLCSPGRGQ